MDFVPSGVAVLSDFGGTPVRVAVAVCGTTTLGTPVLGGTALRPSDFEAAEPGVGALDVVVPALVPFASVFGGAGSRAMGFCLMIDAELTTGTDEDIVPEEEEDDEEEDEMAMEEDEEGVEKEGEEEEEGGMGACWASWKGREKWGRGGRRRTNWVRGTL